jgi:hypothetical protein
MLMRLPVISAAVGHKWIKGTVQDYLRPTTKETEFLIDMFSRPVPEILVKWYPKEGDLFYHPLCAPMGAPGREEVMAAEKALEAEKMKA